LPFDAYAYTFDMCTNKVYLLTYLLIREGRLHRMIDSEVC